MRIKKRTVLLGLFLLFLLFQLQPFTAVQGEVGAALEGQGRYIVLMQPGVMDAQRKIGLQRAVDASGGRVKTVFSAAINGFSAELPPGALEQLRKNPDIVLIEPDSVVSIADDWQVIDAGRVFSSQSDPVWGLDRIDQRDLPLDQTFTYDTTAGDVHVYVLDTGLRATHEEFTGRVGDGFTAIDDGLGTTDCNGHGTHVAGTIGGSIYGVAKGVTLHPVRVMNCDGEGYLSDVIAGLDWVLEQGLSPGVINLSLGGGASDSLDLAVNNAIDAGFTVVAAAGNTGGDACQVSPARVSEAITVGATDSSDKKPSFSNIGGCLDVFAPGVSITSAYPSSDSGYATASGTSMAAPHAAGGAALYLQVNPSATPQNVAEFLINSATSAKINNPGSGSPNLLLYTRVGPIPLQPAGTIFQESNTFEWARVEGASKYELEVFEGTVEESFHTEQFGAEVCGTTQCSAEPKVMQDLSEGEYQWRVRAYLDEQWGDWTDKVAFLVAELQTLFLPVIINQ